ncbi:MAG: alpha/beta fold hydrolase [Rhodospirillaceae bacterium]|nr:alpha/beta fold hydrolase [Rhodospirillaceae bacterium]
MRLKFFLKLLLGVVLSCAALSAASAAGADTRIVERDGRKIAFQIIAGTSPAIVLDAGGGADSSYWSTLAPELSKQTGAQIITYDRAGLGGSDDVPGPWSLTGAIDDLEAGLHALGATRGIILVSHSLAGEVATGITTRHPDWFAGAVLVDANIPDFFTDEMIARQVKVYTPILEKVRKAPSTPGNRQLLAMGAAFESVSRAYHKMTWPNAVPVAVIVAEKTPHSDPADAQAWRDAQALFASKAANRSLIVADKSSHDVAHDRPDVVLNAIFAMRRGQGAAVTGAAYDVVIRNGKLLDGSGNPWVGADVAIKDGRFVQIGTVSGRGSREIDATGQFVTPGWIDVMDQSGESLLQNGRAENKVLQGVTTAVAGESGTPVGSAKLADYFDRLEKQGLSVNFGTLYGASQARVEVMGDVDGLPTAAQLDQERAHVEEAMRAGAMGLGTALIYAPASYQQTPELVELAKVAHRYGGIYAHHMRDEGETLLPSIEESIAISEQSGIPVEIYHLKAAFAPGWGKLMPAAGKLIEDARARGIDIAADIYPYTAGGTGLDITVPNWVWAEGKEKGLIKLADPAIRSKLKKQVAAGSMPGWTNLVTASGGWNHVVLVTAHNAKYDQYRFKDIATIARALNRDPADVAWDIVLEGAPHRPIALYFGMSEKDIETALRFPWTSIGTDGTATSGDQEADGHPRAYGTFPRVISEYVRERGVLKLEDAIRKMTSWPAARFKLFDRGAIRVGLRADVTIFDYDKIKDIASYEKPTAYPEGISYVLVNGVPVVDGGRHTGAKPGTVIRGQGWTQAK